MRFLDRLRGWLMPAPEPEPLFEERMERLESMLRHPAGKRELPLDPDGYDPFGNYVGRYT